MGKKKQYRKRLARPSTPNDELPNIRSDEETEEATDDESSDEIKHHPKFFFEDTLVAILVGKTLFNVHKYQLLKSEVLSDMLMKPKPEGDEPQEGSSPEYPIKLTGISASDFAALLKVLYASHFSTSHPTPRPSLVIPAFRVANVFNFTDLRAALLPLAEKALNDVEKIVFAREFGINEWLAPAHARLIQRDKPLNTEEARKLEVDSVLLILRLRETFRYLNNGLNPGSDYCDGCAGVYYHTERHTCKHCNSENGYYLCAGPGATRTKPKVDNPAVEAEVMKWIENGFVMGD